MIDVAGTELVPEDREVLRHPLVGGVILFSRNYQDPLQVARLVADIRALRPALLVAVDQEGGRVQRLREGFTRLPTARALGLGLDDQPGAVRARCRAAGWLMAAELFSVGIDISFAPVLDLDRGVSSVIGDRAFATDPGVVAELAGAFIDGMARAGMAATGKHFPGHGGVAADSHVALPEDARDTDALAADLSPFKALISRGRLGAVMMAHVVYRAVDAWPASLSPHWIRTVLRGRAGFAGAVFCDDLSMAGAAMAGDMPARARQALDAGCDMLPVCNDRSAVITLLDALRVQDVSEAGPVRLAALRRAPLQPPGLATVQRGEQWLEARAALG